MNTKMKNLASVVNDAEDEIFESFCEKIGVPDIRVYEGSQLRAVVEASAARVRHDTQIARMGHAIKFDTDNLDALKKRLETLRGMTTMENNSLKGLKKRKKEVEKEVEAMQAEVQQLQEALEEANKALEEQKGIVEEKKKIAARTAKSLDKALKDIGMKVCCVSELVIISLTRSCRTTKLSKQRWRDQASTVAARWTRSIYRSFPVTLRTCLWTKWVLFVQRRFKTSPDIA